MQRSRSQKSQAGRARTRGGPRLRVIRPASHPGAGGWLRRLAKGVAQAVSWWWEHAVWLAGEPMSGCWLSAEGSWPWLGGMPGHPLKPTGSPWYVQGDVQDPMPPGSGTAPGGVGM